MMSKFSQLLERIEKKQTRVAIIGLGYIGLPTALFYRMRGQLVHGIDTNQELIDELRRGQIRVREESLERMAETHLGNISLDAHYDRTHEQDVFVLCLPTPIGENGKPVIHYLTNSVSDIAQRVERECLVIVESTVPVGTTEMLADLFAERGQGKLDDDFWVAHCPERALPGRIIDEMESNHRLAGGVTADSTELATAFLGTVFKPELVHSTTSRISETTKLAENTFRDVNIAFANELARLCTAMSVDVREVIPLANLHPRVSILNPGVGVGGYCLPKDGLILVDSARNRGMKSVLIPAAREVNDSMPSHVSKRIEDVLFDLGLKTTVGLVGLSFKPNISDTRNSPALSLIKLLGQRGIEVVTYDPLVEDHLGNRRVDSLEELLQSCKVLVVCTGHDVLLAELKESDLGDTVLVDPNGAIPQMKDAVREYIGLTV